MSVYSQVEVAKKFRISAQLVSRLVVEARKQPEKLREKKAREKQQLEALQATESVASEMLACGKSIRSSQQVQMQVEAKHQVELSRAAVRRILKKELGLGYRTAGKVPMHANSERCLVLR